MSTHCHLLLLNVCPYSLLFSSRSTCQLSLKFIATLTLHTKPYLCVIEYKRIKWSQANVTLSLSLSLSLPKFTYLFTCFTPFYIWWNPFLKVTSAKCKLFHPTKYTPWTPLLTLQPLGGHRTVGSQPACDVSRVNCSFAFFLFFFFSVIFFFLLLPRAASSFEELVFCCCIWRWLLPCPFFLISTSISFSLRTVLCEWVKETWKGEWKRKSKSVTQWHTQ